MTLETLLKQNQETELLRIATAGSVDDGKSTLIGRLLYDSKSIFEDQLESIKEFSAAHRAQEIDYSLVTDGLKSEREQGITIDVAYRYFTTPKRRFIIADTPGHEQYTRNMATGASTASLSLILIDATRGVVTQTRRHSFISSLLGIKHFLVAINKMDLIDYSEDKFNAIVNDYKSFADKLSAESIHFIPISALKGDNVIEKSTNMNWYLGSPLLDYIETVNVAGGRNLIDFRFPVQYVNWSGGSGFRGYCGTISSGIIRKGEKVKVLPSGEVSEISRIVTYEGDLDYAYSPKAVTLVLKDDIDISRGNMIVRQNNSPPVTSSFEANVVWMDSNPLTLNKKYIIKHTSRMTRGVITAIKYKFDPEDLHRKNVDTLKLNEIGKTRIELTNPVFADLYDKNRATGSFIIIDPVSNLTAGAGMITSCLCTTRNLEKSIEGHTAWYKGKNQADRAREDYNNQSVKSVFLDDDLLKKSINTDVADKTAEYVRRTANLCRLLNDSGINVIINSEYSPDSGAEEIIGKDKFRII